MSIFCVGLSQNLKMTIVLQGLNFSSRTIPIERPKKQVINFEQKTISSHNQSMQDQIGRNLNISGIPKNSISNNKRYEENQENDYYQNHIRCIIKKISIFAQYIHSLPNSTYLLTLLNISNYFSLNNSMENYLLSIYLTASSMTQARLFIQAWELFNKIQFSIIQNKSQILDIKYFFDSNIKMNDCNEEKKISYFLAKIEILKGICMYEYGQIGSFLDSLINSLQIFSRNDFSSLKLSILWSKSSEISYNKFYIQNYITKHVIQIIEFIFLLLKDKSEIVLFYALKTLEFIIDYFIHNITKYIPKMIKLLFKLINPRKSKTSFLNDQIDKDLRLEIEQFKRFFSNRNLYFNENLVEKFLTEKNNRIDENIYSNGIHDSINPLLIKQINYTFDTLITNLDSIPSAEIGKLINSSYILDIISLDLDSITNINIIKFIKKTLENSNSNNISNSPELIIKLFMKGIDLSINNVKSILNYNSNPTNKSQKFHNSPQINAFNMSKFNFLDKTEIGELILSIIEIIYEDKFMFSVREDTNDLLNWITESLDILLNYMVNFPPDQINSNVEQRNMYDFSKFYSVFLFYLLDNLFLNNPDSRSMVYGIMINHMKTKIFNNIESLLNVLVKYEEFSLTNREFFIFFEISIEIFTKIKNSLKNSFEFNFYYFLIPQYVQLINVLEKSGIFNENLVFLVRTLPLLDGENFYKEENIMVMKKLFSLILLKFPNFFNEEIFVVFNLLLEKIEDHLNGFLINEIIIAFKNKYTYKGNNLIRSKSKFFDVILKKAIYFEYFIKNLSESITQFTESFQKFNGNLNNMKEIYFDFTEKLDLLMKFLEHIKKDEELFTNLNFHVLYNVVINNLNFRIFTELSQCQEETLVAKISEYSCLVIEILVKMNESIYKSNSTKSEDLIFSQSLIMTYIIYVITNNILFINENTKSCFLIIENCKIMTKLVKMIITLNKFNNQEGEHQLNNSANLSSTNLNLVNLIENSIVFKNESNKFFDFLKSVEIDPLKFDPGNFISFKLKLVKIILERAFQKKENFNKLIIIEYFCFIEKIIEFLKLILESTNEIENNLLEDFTLVFQDIVVFLLTKNEERYELFALEIILKMYNFNFQSTLESNLEGIQNIKQKCKLVSLMLWEKIFTLIESKNYKVSILSYFVIQVLSYKEDVSSFIRIRSETTIFNEKIKITSNSNENSLLHFKFVDKSCNIESLQKNFWINFQTLNEIYILIKEKIIVESNNKRINENNFPTLPSNLEKNNHDIDNDDEYLDLIKIPELINEGEIEDQNFESYEYEPRNVSRRKSNNFKNNESNPENQNNYNKNLGLNLNKILKDDNALSLEELGVFEAGDEIFENFDEENIPVIKNIYKRKKGSAEKLKTNQGTKSLLMSNHNFPNNNNYVDTNSVNNHYSQNIPGNNYYTPANEQNKHQNLNFYSKILSSPKEMNMNSINIDNIDLIEKEQLLDLQSKKKNIRPQNGLRPATPPIKPFTKQVNKNTYINAHNLNNFNQNSNLREQINQNELNRRNNATSKTALDKKYEIKSMEELFIEEESKEKELNNDNDFEEENLNQQQQIYHDNYSETKNDYQNNIYEFEGNNKENNPCNQYYEEDNQEQNFEEASAGESLSMEDYHEEFIENSYPISDNNENQKNFQNIKSQRPPTRYGNREDQVLWNKIIPSNNLKSGIIQNNYNRNKIDKNNHSDLNINNTFNNKKNSSNIMNRENYRISSPQEKNRSSQNLKTYLNSSPIESRITDFRKNLQWNLTKNSNKIVENIRKLNDNTISNASRTINPQTEKKSVSSLNTRLNGLDSPLLQSLNIGNTPDLFHHSSISGLNSFGVQKSKSPDLNKISFEEQNKNKIKFNSFLISNPEANLNKKNFNGNNNKNPN